METRDILRNLREKNHLTQEELKAQLTAAQDKTKDTGRFRLWKGRVKRHEKAADK